ncbi:Nonribosomal peptide synthetase dtxS1 [Cladobotryum mycophilum]|uniref:Nonribosomal peptide synthetase dtxS1 n=1 Tax=Cladobotryum mycophilum TaxID=491253 RepID=A0ABR0S8H8_9HYPO
MSQHLNQDYQAQKVERHEPHTIAEGLSMDPTDVEHRLRCLWAQVLDIRENSIGKDAHFLNLGGDSMAAINLVGAVRNAGMSLNVAEVFRQPILGDQAVALTKLQSEEATITPFSLLPVDSVETLRDDLSALCGLTSASVEDAYPCTPLQRELISSQETGNMLQMVLELSDDINIASFQNAWEQAIAFIPILRTRIVQHDHFGLVQVVCRGETEWNWAQSDLDEYLEKDRSLTMEPGSRLLRFALVHGDDMKARYFVLSIHMAIYDEWSLLSHILDVVNEEYWGTEPDKGPSERVGFNAFVKHLLHAKDADADEYWKSYLADGEFTPFPSLPTSVKQPRAHRSLELDFPFQPSAGVTGATTLRGALALLVSRRTASPDVVFGGLGAGRCADLVGVEGLIGPMAVKVPVRVLVREGQTIQDYLQVVQQEAVDMIPFEQTGVNRISQLSHDGRSAAGFQTLLVMRHADEMDSGALGVWRTFGLQQHIGKYALTLECLLRGKELKIRAFFDPEVINEWTVELMTRQLKTLIEQLSHSRPEQTLGDVRALTRDDEAVIWNWNQSVPPASERYVCDFIRQQARERPDSPAISAWDGDLRYGELDELSERLACYLVQQREVGPEVLVPLCCEKSLWAVVAILAVLKAGGAFVPLDPSQGESRRQFILEQTRARLVLVTASHKGISLPPGCLPFVVDRQSLDSLSNEVTQPALLPQVEPKSAAYVIFTSGSTGQPKGVVIEHRAISTSSQNHGPRYKCGPTSRVLQFASYTFDASLLEILTTLCFGACVCIPSEEERLEDLAGFINAKSVNLAILTPTVSRTLRREDVPTLGTLVLVGEAVTQIDYETWAGAQPQSLFNAYGPTEAAVLATVSESCGVASRPDNIGKATGCVTWVVNRWDHTLLAPLGTVGELVLEGHVLAREYLHDAEKTSAVFIKDPAWLLKGTKDQPGRTGRIYKTGDLVRYNEDGSLTFLGRKDDQVKVRGRRVELGEIEYHVKACMPFTEQLVTDVITPGGQASNPILTVFLTTKDYEKSPVHDIPSLGTPLTVKGLELIPVHSKVEAMLSQWLPTYMIPTLYIKLSEMPLLPSGKTNRKKLREIGSSLSAMQLAELQTDSASESQGQGDEPQTEAGRLLRDLWADMFHVDPDSLGVNSDFFRHGGDSVVAMKLVGAARKAGCKLTVAGIFEHPVLAAQARIMRSISETKIETIEPFSLLGDNTRTAEEFCKGLSALYDVDPSLIEDAYPCTLLQEGFMSESTRNSSLYVSQIILELSRDIQIEAFMSAWEEVVRTTHVLRTRIYHSKLGLVQVVYRNDPKWTRISAGGLEKYLETDKMSQMKLGDPLSRFAIMMGDENESPKFVCTLHHSLYDGWSLPIIENLTKRAYNAFTAAADVKSALEAPASFNSFIRYISEAPSPAADEYWTTYLADGEFAPFPPLPTSVTDAQGDQSLEMSFRLNTPMDVTTSSLLRGALALLLSQYTGNSDVIFGTVVTGRNAPVVGIEEIVGPTIAAVPVRVDVSKDRLVSEYLQLIQRQATEMISFEQTGLTRISKMSDICRTACDFQTLLVIQPQEGVLQGNSFFGKWHTSDEQEFVNYALTLECFLEGDKLRLRASFDSHVLSQSKVEWLMHHFTEILRQLSDPETARVRIDGIDTVTAKDRELLWQWNQLDPVMVEKCVHDVICEHAQTTPDRPAVCSWDGNLTYHELDELSTRLAAQLVLQGVGPEVVVPLCFEKSVWTIVAVLGVLKSGGAFVLLDSNLPDARLQRICHQVQATVAVTSPSNQQRLPILSAIVLSRESLEAMPLHMPSKQSAVTPSNAAYVIFTSGSTGEPKGCVIEHRSYCSVATHGRTMHMSQETRTLQFGSYSFAGAIMEILMTLIYGGCICVPSEEQRRDGQLAQTIRKLDVSWAFLTATVLSQLKPEDVPSLRTITIGGEAIRSSQITEWASKVELRQTYGSSETSAVISSARLVEYSSTSSDVGKAEAGRYWIVSPTDSNRLMPVGVPGEILLEGPTVGRHYLGLAEKTAEVFIDCPAWRSSFGTPATTSRFYKMGDIGAFKPDGSIELLARKDMQIKLRGQRIEIGEIEYQAKIATPDLKAVAVELTLLHGSTGPALIGFLVFDMKVQDDSKQGSKKFDARIIRAVKTIQESLESVLPYYMVPSVLVPVSHLPLTPSGKIDRRRLRQMGSDLSGEELATLRTLGTEGKRMPQTEMEHRLRDVWAQVLNIKAERIGIDDTFFQVGGDSITAMQVSSSARALLGEISSADVLQKKTIARLAAQLSSSADQAHTQTILNINDGQPFQLSPIQHLYALLEPDPTRCFDQGFYLGLRSNVSLNALEKAVETVVSRHPMLRSRFNSIEGVWQQQVVDDVPSSFHVDEIEFVRPIVPSEEQDAVRQCREQINIQDGPVLTAVLLKQPDSLSFFITAHHILIDLVSWRVILQELEELLTSKQAIMSSSMDFQTWTILQAQHTATSLSNETYDVQLPLLSYWGVAASQVVEGETIQRRFMLDNATSAALLGKCNEAFGTRPLELLIAALIHSFHAIFSDRAVPDIFTEGHGREPWDDAIDVARTVGWFSTLFPVSVPSTSTSSLPDTVRQVKDWIRSLSKNGWSYFNSKFGDDEKARVNAKGFPSEILFNFAGSFQQLEREDSLFENLVIPSGAEASSFTGLSRFSVFVVEAQVERGCLSMLFDYPRALCYQDKISAWTNECQTSLESLVADLGERSPEWTLADFPMAFTSYNEISEFEKRLLQQLNIKDLSDVEDIYPCSPIQEGILIAQSKDPRNYRTVLQLELVASNGHVIDVSKVEQAWRAVVQRHSLLRAVVVDNMPGSNTMMNIILKNPQPSISLEDSVIAEESSGSAQVSYHRYGPQHHLSVYRPDGNRLNMKLEMNHIIADGHSHSNILIRDFKQAYNGDLEPIATSYVDFVKYIGSRPQEIDQTFWVERLAGVEPCILPGAPKGNKINDAGFALHVHNVDVESLRGLCTEAEVTMSTVIETSWALVLLQFTGLTTPCFGVIASGRDIPVKHVDEVFGPIINMIPLRPQIETGSSVIETLRRVHEEYVSSLPHQQYPLMAIHRDLNISQSGLFNTLFNYQRIITAVDDVEAFSLTNVGSQDPLDFDILLDVIDSGEDIDITLSFGPNFTSRDQGTLILNAFSNAMRSLIANSRAKIGNVSLLGSDDEAKIWAWNSTLPKKVNGCMHNLLTAQASITPDAVAISAWDGELTYRELETLSTRLASHLIMLGIETGMIIPLCFEKSMWTLVTVFAVSKAGGTVVLFDTTLPEARLRSMWDQCAAKIVCTSEANRQLAAQFSTSPVVIGLSLFDEIPDVGTESLPEVDSESPFYVCFTSGSTGRPKGLLVSHSNYRSALHSQIDAFDVSSDSRIYDFASYSFDITFLNTFVAISSGACLCIPSEEQRKTSLNESLRDTRATLVVLTPSAARILEPTTLSDLRTLMLVGEPLTISDIQRWWGHFRVMNVYGPSECTSLSIMNTDTSSPEMITRLGIGMGSRTWVVDPIDHNKLVPIGAIGELLIEGPIVGRGYLGEPEKTEAAFIVDPTWLLRGLEAHVGHPRSKLYKTGDLVQYNNDGSLSFVRRKDTQVKIRGQRLELGEVESHVQQCMPAAQQIVAEVIIPEGKKDSEILVVFFTADTKDTASLFSHSSQVTDDVDCVFVSNDMQTELSQRLPSYMLPSMYFFMKALPTTATDKTDRKQLRAIGSEISLTQLAELRTRAQGEKRQPQTEREHQLRALWAQVLSIDVQNIGIDDNFFSLGGDSITGMRLADNARRIGIILTVTDIFRHPMLEVQARAQSGTSISDVKSIEPFSLLDDSIDRQQLLKEISAMCTMDERLIEDAYPCTPLQEGLFSLSIKQRGNYILQAVQELSSNVDIEALKQALEDVVQVTAILRTRFVQHTQLGLIQVVCREEMDWQECGDYQALIQADRSAPMGLGDRLCRFGLADSDDGLRLVFSIHHAIYDGAAFTLLVAIIEKAYAARVSKNMPERLTERTKFNTFVRHVRDVNDDSETYWRSYLENAEFTPFPSLPASVTEPAGDKTLEFTIKVVSNASEVTMATVIRGAVSIVIGQHTNSTDVIFGAISSGRNAPVANVSTIVGPTIATVPVRVRLQSDQTIRDYLKTIQQQSIDTTLYEQLGLQRIARISEDTRTACDFQTLLVIQPKEASQPGHGVLGSMKAATNRVEFTTYAITLECSLGGGEIAVKASFDTRVLDEWKMQNLMRQFSHTVDQLTNATPEQTIGDISGVTENDRSILGQWNGTELPMVERRVHDVIGDHIQARPDATAVCSWDGEITYQELDKLSMKLAWHLNKLGVVPETVVPLCFEKSLWTVVAILGVLRAGGAFVLLDPRLPEARLNNICKQVNAQLGITSPSCQARLSNIVSQTVALSQEMLQGLDNESETPLPWTQASPTNAAYVIFTSGSTVGHGSVMNMSPETRALQFGSYSFAGAIMETLMTLMYGGCVCIPSEEQRGSQLEEAISKLDANWAFLTSTVLAQLSRPENVPSLRTICVGGEPIRTTQIKEWAPKVHLRQTYGSSETSAVVSSARLLASSHNSEVGKATTGRYWIVDPTDTDRLVPLGAPGEILIEGPTIGREYLDQPEKTAATFIDAPVWRATFPSATLHGSTQFYKTGDIGAYISDASIELLGRKDTQVKLRGQRIETGEIEFQAKRATSHVKEAVVELTLLGDGHSRNPELIGFLVLNAGDRDASKVETEHVEYDAKTKDTIQTVQNHLETVLPYYMVPSVLVPIPQLPLTASGKTDRRRLREVGSALSTQQLEGLRRAVRGHLQLPRTRTEKHLRDLWAVVLNVEAQTISVTDSFFKLGGDSVIAMKLASAARDGGFSLSVSDIFQHPTIATQAEVCSPAIDIEIPPPFSLLGDNLDADDLCNSLAKLCHTHPSLIEDAYPCTPLQEGLLSLSAKRTGEYVMQAILELSDNLELDNFKSAWQRVAAAIPILRTKIVQHSQCGLVQVVAKQDIDWIDATGLEDYLQVDRERPMHLGHQLSRYALVKNETNSHRWFVWSLHHAVYDGFGLPLILDALHQGYAGETLPSMPGFQLFIKYLNSQSWETTADYWKRAMEGHESPQFPALPPSVKQPIANEAIERKLPLKHSSLNITTSTLLQAAWGLVAGRMTNSEDVTFGVTVSGRKAPVPGIDKMPCPVLATVPWRIKFAKDEGTWDYLRAVQQQATDMIQFEQTGLHRIARISPETQQACTFQTLLVIQPQEKIDFETCLGKWRESGRQSEWFNTYALVVHLDLGSDCISARAEFDSRVIEPSAVQQLLARLDFVMQQLNAAGPQQKLSDINFMTQDDLEAIWDWNKNAPLPVERFVHEMIEEVAQARPTASSICAWDGSLTYAQLDSLSTKLASRLAGLYFGPEKIIPLCFNKSMWVPVAMLAVLKAGAAFVLLEPSLPEQRLRAMVQQVKASLILSSSTNLNLSSRLSSVVLEVNSDSLESFERVENPKPQTPPSSTPMFVVFTSGSTGTPKGAVISHQNFSTCIRYHAEPFGFEESSRVFNFASYAFDLSVYEAVLTMATGGCICIPDDRDRSANLSNTMAAMKITQATLTPTVARLLDPLALPDLKTLALVGEAFSTKDVLPWWDRVRVINAYGPAECTACSTINHSPSSPEEVIRIGAGAGQVTWVVDPNDHNVLLPPGCTGELMLEGPLVGLGYINEPEKTAAAFVHDPAWLLQGSTRHQGHRARMYKTGDLVRYNDDGTLTYVGRKDAQTKLRGQRLELGEVEHWVHRCKPEAVQVVAEVIVPQGENASQILAAFVETGDKGQHYNDSNAIKATISTLDPKTEDELAEHLPNYMIPTVLIALYQLPLTPTGKINRRRLREIGASFSRQDLAEVNAGPRESKRQPVTPTERRMQELWAQALHINREMIGLDDSFFKLGGDSIAAMKLVGESHKLHLHLSVADIFRHPRLHAVARQAVHLDEGALDQIPQTEYSGPVQQSFAQARLWFLEQLYPGLTWYHIPWATRIKGQLNVDALKAAILAVESRHDVLRTTFSSVNGINLQSVHPFQPSELKFVDLQGDETALLQAVYQEQTRPFDLETEPGWRVAIYRMSDDDHALSITQHHVISDGWSVDILCKEMTRFYRASVHGNLSLELGPLPFQYRDYSTWQRQQVDTHERQLRYWLKELESSRPAELLCDKPRPATLSGHADKQEIKIEGPLYQKLQQFCQEKEVTPFVVLLAAFRSTHYRLTDSTDATIGAPNANRDLWQVKEMLGFFVNLQCIRIKVQDDTFEELVQHVQSTVTAALDNQDVPFDRIISNLSLEDRDLSRNPLVQILFALHSQTDIGTLSLDGVETEPIVPPMTSRFDMEVHFYQSAQSLMGYCIFSSDLYLPETISSLLSVFHAVLNRALDEPKTQISLLPLFTDEERFAANEMDLLRIHQTDYPRDQSLVDVFCKQVAACPDKIAVKDSSSTLTYAELDQQSDTLARWLLTKRSLSPETLVGVYANRCCQTIVAFLGILKANCAYLPLDVKNPLSRIETILSSVEGHKVVLLGPNLPPPAVELKDVEFIRIQETLDELDESKERTLAKPTVSSLAYVMFTSGSTGKPKGVMIEHRSLIRLVKSNLASLLPPGTVSAHISNIAFDTSAWEIWSTILNGGTLICIDAMTVLDFKAVTETFAREKVQSAFCTPALLKQYLIECPAAIGQLEAILVGGEKLDTQDTFTALALMKGNGKVVNAYGPTENTVFSAFYSIPDGEHCENGVPIGGAISDSGIYILDPRQQLVPVGVLGELVVVGECLARGYTDPQRNADRFVTVRIDGVSMRAYRTGDYGRYRPVDGKLEFMGRLDGQIKIRGQRVEIGEIEHVLVGHNSVNDSVVLVQQQEDQDSQLIGFITIGEQQQQQQSLEEQYQPDEDETAKHIELWKELWDSDKYTTLENVDLNGVGRDFIAWTSMYDGSQLDTMEMNEWLDDTIATIDTITGGAAGNVLEIGTGSGMVLFNLSKGMDKYFGLEPTPTAVDYVMRTAKSIPALADKVLVRTGTAADVSQLKGLFSPDLVIINSVSQYFPSQDYLFKVVEDLVQFGSAKTLFFGDMRSLALYKQFQVSSALHVASGVASRDEVQRKMAEIEQAELELLVDPGFFTALSDRLPHLIEHVEILPKRVKATNELSCYRYAAVVHLKTVDSQRQITDIRQDEWVDFAENKLDRESLVQLLQQSSDSPTVAIGNIPYSKTILERHIVESLDQEVNESKDQDNWFNSVHQKARECPSLSAYELEEIAQQTGFRVEASWGRQYLQRGGLDAVFHRRDVAGQGDRVLFRFPTDHRGRPAQSLTTQPLRQQLKARVIKELYESLRASLPTYMIPQRIIVLEKMPVNENGKVDRRALSKTVQKTTVTVQGEKRQPSSDTEKKMQQIWGHVLNINAVSIGLDDNFFELGGNSISAMRVVGEARKVNILLVVADIFRHGSLELLVHHISTKDVSKIDEQVKDVVLVDQYTKAALLQELESLDLDIQASAVEDILPLTSFQQKAVSIDQLTGPWCHYLYFDLGHKVDQSKLVRNFAWTLERFPLLRSRFLFLQDTFWQIVHKKMEAPLFIQDVEEDLDDYVHRFFPQDLQTLSTTQPPLAVFLLQHKVHGVRLVFRLSHAQYDGVSMPVIFQSLLDGHDETGSAPSFSTFLSYASLKQPQSVKYWKNLLQGSSPAIIPRDLLLPQGDIQDSVPKAIKTTRDIKMPTLPANITPASLVSAAWSLLLSRITGSDDIVFGHNVAGRNSAIPGIETMHCTDWPAESDSFGTLLHHQNIEENPTIRFGDSKCQLQGFLNPHVIVREIMLMSYPRGSRLELNLMSNTTLMTSDAAQALVDAVGEIIEKMANSMNTPLASFTDSLDLGSPFI